MSNRPILVLAANTPWVYSLARALSAHTAVTAMRFYDWINERRLRPEWPEMNSAVRRVHIGMPPGYAGTLEPLFRPLMRSTIKREAALLGNGPDTHPLLI